MKTVYLAGAVRTPIGRFGGSLGSWTAADLGTAVAKETLRRAHVRPDQVDDSIWGCARQAGGGPNVGRQITFRAGVPDRVPAFTVNQACGSGLRAIILAARILCSPAVPKACRAFLTLPKARAGACAWVTLSWLTECIATASTIRFPG